MAETGDKNHEANRRSGVSVRRSQLSSAHMSMLLLVLVCVANAYQPLISQSLSPSSFEDRGCEEG